MLALEPQQFADEQVVVGIGDLGTVERVVALVVVRDLAAEDHRPGRQCRRSSVMRASVSSYAPREMRVAVA